MRRLISSLISILTIFLVSCDSGQQSKTNNDINNKTEIDSDTVGKTIINETKINNPFGQNNLRAFKQFSDSLIRVALNKKTITYTLNADTLQGVKAKNVYYDYFDSDSLKKVIRLGFSLPSPYSRYSFSLLSYEYTSPKSAFISLDKVATIAYSSYFGLNKEPAYVFRINNYLFWLSTPNSLSGKTFNSLKDNLANQFKPNPIDELENHIQFSKLTGLGQENFIGKWRLKLISSVFQDDTAKKEVYDNNIVEIHDKMLRLDSIEYPIDQINKLRLPDVQTFLIYNGLIWRDTLILNSTLRKFKGSVIQYSIFFKDPVSIMDKKYHHDLFKEEPLGNFIKISDREFGFIKDDAYYKLTKVN